MIVKFLIIKEVLFFYFLINISKLQVIIYLVISNLAKKILMNPRRKINLVNYIR